MFFLIQLMLNLQLINTGLILSTGSIEHALSLCVYYDLYDMDTPIASKVIPEQNII